MRAEKVRQPLSEFTEIFTAVVCHGMEQRLETNYAYRRWLDMHDSARREQQEHTTGDKGRLNLESSMHRDWGHTYHRKKRKHTQAKTTCRANCTTKIISRHRQGDK